LNVLRAEAKYQTLTTSITPIVTSGA
jgi:hypothetical protein